MSLQEKYEDEKLVSGALGRAFWNQLQENKYVKSHLSKSESMRNTVQINPWTFAAVSINEPARLVRAVVVYDGGIYIGSAYCDPKDKFDAAKGTKTALFRAMDRVNMSDTEREDVLAYYKAVFDYWDERKNTRS